MTIFRCHTPITRLSLVLVALWLLASPALAGNLRVTLNMAVGQDSLSFELSDVQTRSFWSKWRALGTTEDIVPMPTGSSYGGLTLYDRETGDEVRLYNGIGRMDETGKADTYRQLERWVLGFAPMPLGPALIARLDDDVRAQPGGSVFLRTSQQLSGDELINTCRHRAGRNAQLKAACLQEQLLQQLDPAAYANALEDIARQQLPARAKQLP